jgi:proteic killer suppression protein
MILHFRHRGLERLHWRGETSGVSTQHVKRLRSVLAALERAAVPSDMALPGNWRVVFGFEGHNVTNDDLVDYH